MVKITIERKAGTMLALVRIIDGNETQTIWLPDFLVDILTSKSKSELRTLKDDGSFTDLGDIDV